MWSPQHQVAEQGQDLEEIYEEIKAAQELAASMGLELAPPVQAADIAPEKEDETPSGNGKKDRALLAALRARR